ncbi:hypothetical protein NL108_016381 [Boleophthalmus pectinirostris]|nr:hypothetical protein NL108_016381 [Boleophthalmus pectinirostris]
MADEDISLYNLLNLSITSPGQGTVNFRALYALLHGILRQLDLRDITVSFSDTGPQKSPPEPRTEAEGEPRSRTGGPRETEETEDPPGTGPGSTQESVGDDKHVLELIHRIQKQTEHLQDNVRELRHQQDKASAAQAQWVTSLESHGRRVDALEEAVRRPEEDERYVTWEAMKSALITERQNLHKGLVQTTKDENVTKTEPKTSHVPPPPSKTQTKESGTGTEAKDAPGPGSTPAPPVVPPVASSVVPALKSLSQTACASSLHQETLEALRDIGRLKQRCDGLEERLCALDLERSRERQELLRLRDLLHNTGPDEVFEAMKEELDELRALVRNLLSDRDKGSQRKGSAEEQTAGGSDKDQEPKPGLDPGLDPGLEMFRTEVAEMWREFNKLRVQVRSVQLSLKELRDRVETSPENTEQSLQDQLDDLRGLLTQTMESLSSELRLQVGPVNRVSESSFNLLFQEHEQLKDTDNALLQQQPSTGTETGRDTQSAQLVSEVQKAILLLQTECEKLHETTQCLLEDNQQKQTHIEELYKMTEEMEEKKADKNMVETEIRADKTALDSKVSRVQFDSVTEQLSNMFNELLTKVSDQEQDWSKLMEKLSTEMDCKLNRIELDPVKKQLEARWKSIQERMKKRGSAGAGRRRRDQEAASGEVPLFVL